jgi:hypothetical protein
LSNKKTLNFIAFDRINILLGLYESNNISLKNQIVKFYLESKFKELKSCNLNQFSAPKPNHQSHHYYLLKKFLSIKTGYDLSLTFDHYFNPFSWTFPK